MSSPHESPAQRPLDVCAEAPKPGAALEIADLSVGYGAVPVVREASLTVRAGEVVALLGANGAGKTTLLLSAAGVLRPSHGAVRVLGRSVLGRRPHQVAAAGLVLVPDDRGVFHTLTVRENLRLGRGDDLDRALDLFPALRPLLGRRCGLLSGGEQQMLAVAKALQARPRVLLVDELSLGLAPVIVQKLLPTLRQLAREQDIAVLLVEQHTHVALDVADRAYVMRRGRIVLEGEAGELNASRELLETSYLTEKVGGVA
jgi:branched-chain amino acid transport system ATP-binding protein